MPISARDMPPRVLACIKAFRALQPHRAYSVSDTPPEALLREPFFFNPRICSAQSGVPLSGIGWRPVAEAGVRRIGDLRRLLTAGLPPGVTLGSAVPCLPPCRRSGALHFMRIPRWTRWSGCSQRVAAAPPLGAAPPRHQALAPRAVAPGGSQTSWRAPPAASALPRRPRQPPSRLWLWYGTRAAPGTRARARAPPSSRPALSPTSLAAGLLPLLTLLTKSPPTGGWRVGKEPCTQLVVKGANLRLQAARAILAGYHIPVRCPLRTALWEGGLRATEDRWRATLAGRGLMARLAPVAADGPRARRDPAFDGALDAPAPAAPGACAMRRRAR